MSATLTERDLTPKLHDEPLFSKLPPASFANSLLLVQPPPSFHLYPATPPTLFIISKLNYHQPTTSAACYLLAALYNVLFFKLWYVLPLHLVVLRVANRVKLSFESVS